MTDKKHKTTLEEQTEQAKGKTENELMIEKMQKEIEELIIKNAEFLDGLQRERADFANYKKRVERDHVQSTQDTAGRIAKKYLPVLDDLERALKARPHHGEGHVWSQGVELIYKKLQSILESEGMSEIKAEGQPFDPTRHEALTQEVSDKHQSGEIIEVIQKGYMIGERVIRPALVRVAQ
ncbi:MAG: nucleotide exchange factor GrpE [Anaerolinea sp.]|nr:nucleotide exchange factor GrpE [Anaerolinea sp.]